MKPTHEKLANVLGVVHASIQFPGCPCIVDPDLNGCGVHQRQVWHKGRSGNSQMHVHILPSSFLYISSSGIPADHYGRGSASGQGVVLGRGSLKVQHTVAVPGNEEEVPARIVRGRRVVVGASLAKSSVCVTHLNKRKQRTMQFVFLPA